MIILIEEEMLSTHCLLFCPNCERKTNHNLSHSKEFYACGEKGCTEIIEIEIKEIEDETE